MIKVTNQIQKKNDVLQANRSGKDFCFIYMNQQLITGGERAPFLPRLLAAIHHADEIDVAVAFIKVSGLALIYPALKDAVEIRQARLRILTSDYLDLTDSQALRRLMLFTERGAEVFLFESKETTSFHMKAYICVRKQADGVLSGSAFIGSSNISRTALTDGLEWNYCVDLPTKGSEEAVTRFNEILHEYYLLLEHPQVIPLTYDWIEGYERRRKVIHLPVDPGGLNPEETSPYPSEIQQEALQALEESRRKGYQRGLVVMATGLGKTYLSAFDATKMNAKRVLFVAHREEILFQAEESFLRVRPHARVGRYNGIQKDFDVDLLFASVQTLGRSWHLDRFDPGYFDYIVVDEFHHAAASTYRRLLSHFKPQFLLGLTATPDRTDHSDILSLCDDNLIFTRDLIFGIEKELLCPFTYYGIYDESVDYSEIPWRNGRFDPESLSNKLATLARARHAFRQWREKAQRRTLAFCVSIRHARFMAQSFQKEGLLAESVYQGSSMDRSEALEKLERGDLEVVFSVDLFNEGVDIPMVDTVMMLRPTESKVLFIQQLGRGLRRHPSKERLVVLDFIGNHQSFLNKPQALFGVGNTYRSLSEFAHQVKEGRLVLPHGCYVNYDLQIIDFLASLAGDSSSLQYRSLKASLGRRPTMTEYYRSGASINQMRKQYGQWWCLIQDEDDLKPEESECLQKHQAFFKEVETTAMTRCFKAVLLDSLLENDGFRNPPDLNGLAEQALKIFRRRRRLIQDIREDFRDLDQVSFKSWSAYWKSNPINAWIGGNRNKVSPRWFDVSNGQFRPTFNLTNNELGVFQDMLQELVDYRLAAYEPRLESDLGQIVALPRLSHEETGWTEIPYFPNLQIACGHFRTGLADAEEYRHLGVHHGRLDPTRHFIARAVGDSMNGGKSPIHDGDNLLLERLDSVHAGSLTGTILVIERQDLSGDDQYLLRLVKKRADGRYILKATNPAYPDYEVSEDMRTLARLKEVLDPLEWEVRHQFMREEIPALFGTSFNPGSWNSSHVIVRERKAHILLVTLNKQGKVESHRYHDYFLDEKTFHWQSQNITEPESSRGRELIDHVRLGLTVHLFIRSQKLIGKKSAPFQYYGPVEYQSHTGRAPMSILWRLKITCESN